ncbi:MAG: NADH-quinone oxidoreductase subunit L [Acidimicrobiaceae bacterium]|nr:NADH-quinone oxidoreductase subunit L [Acidimicrobiaceae bacterium]
MDAAYVIVALPLLAALVLFAGGKRIGKPLSGWIATGCSIGAFIATVVVWLTLLGRNGDARVVDKNIFTWIPAGGLHVSAALQLDPLSVAMGLFVTGVGSLIVLYSIGYMAHDEEFPRFFFLLSLFLTSMLVLVLADNYLFSFVGWEGVGFCSYALVGFWFERNSAAVAAKKAFVTNRIGDIGFMVALFLMFEHFHSFNYSAVLTPLMAGHAGAIAGATATGLGVMLFLGAAGKSAQIPLYMWLPDAMEGPTPVSALIHAATMVTAGVYLMARSAPILHYTHSTQVLIACVGAATAIFAATIACAQDDIKRVLAYSTLSQLGYMFLAEGSGGFTDGLFHMITHAFFKALLFLSAGSVIHAMSDEQNMKKMGNLRRYLPITFPCFMIGYLALSGIFPFAGFWSKDDTLDAAWHFNKGLWVVGAVTAVLTAYYMTRQVMLVWYGQARWSEATPTASQGGGSHFEHGEPHESPPVMWIPLVILAFASLFGGLINLPFFGANFLERWLEPVFPASIVPVIHIASGTKLALSLIVLAGCLAGIAFGARAWQTAERPDLEPAVLRHGWYIDEAVSLAVSGPLADGANDLAYVVDAGVIDGAVNGVGRLSAGSGRVLRRLQTGYVRNYAIGIALGAAVALLYVAARIGS